MVSPLTSATISKKAAKSRKAARAAEAMAYPLVRALVVLPAESSLSVLSRTSEGWLLISAIPPPLSVMGPKVSMARMNAEDPSMAMVPMAVP